MSEYTGSATYAEWVHPAGTAVLSSDYRKIEVDEPIDTVDSSAGSDTHRSMLTTLTTGRITLEMLDQTGGTVLFDALKMGTDGTLTIGPEGTATGKPKQSIHAVVTGRNRVLAYDDITVLNITFNMQAAAVDSVY